MKHTPASWRIVDNVPDACIGYRAIIDADGTTICDSSPMGEANARLIAAAPDLLAALQQCLRLVDAYRKVSGGDGDIAAMNARAAIAKAKGQA